MPLSPDTLSPLAFSAQLCCVGVFIQSMELLSLHRELRDWRFLGWQGPSDYTHPIRRLIQRLQSYPICISVLFWRAAASGVSVLLSYRSMPMAWLLGSLVLAQIYYNRRFFMVFTNADNMNLVMLSAVTIGSLPNGSARLQTACLFFVAFQQLQAYFGSGLNKLLTPPWRNGVRLTQVFRDSAYRFPVFGKFLDRHQRVAILGSWGVILLELFFPFSIFLPPAGFWAFIAGGLAFHALVAFTMRLNSFWWSFSSAYSALYFVHSKVSAILSPAY